MSPDLKWLRNATGTPWHGLANAIVAGLPVPDGFVAGPREREEDIRSAYEELKIRERTHFVAVRGSSHAVLDVLGPDKLIHTMRRLWTESPELPLLVQRMVNASWSGKATWDGKTARRILRIKANEGLLLFDPDLYVFNQATGKCAKNTLQPRQRKMIRRIDGMSKTIGIEGERVPLNSDHLKAVAELANRAQSNIGWAIDDNGRIWLISVHRNPEARSQ
jgi:hypothetical protein